MFYLAKEDNVRIISSSSYYNDWQKSADIVKIMGFTPLMASDLCSLDPANILPFANSYEYRKKSLIDALYEKESKVIWAVRGGHGLPELLNELRHLTPPEHPKLIIGFSDVTALLLFVTQKWGWKAIHGPVLSALISSYDQATNQIKYPAYQEMTDILTGKQDQITFSNLQPLNEVASNISQINTTVIGGNLSIIQRSLGTFWQINSKDKILLIEDTNEPPRKIDAMLVQLEQANIFKEAKAVIFADFDFSQDTPELQNQQQEVLIKLFAKFAQKYTIPVLRLSGIGHTTSNRPIFFNTPAQLHLGQNNDLIVQTGNKDD